MKTRSAVEMHVAKTDKPLFDIPSELADGVKMEVIATDPSTGGFSCFLHGKKGGTFAPHMHLAGCDYLIMSGALNYRDELAPAGDSGYEPYGSIHEETVFPEETVMLFISHGPIMFMDNSNNPQEIMDSRWVDDRIADLETQAA